MSFSRRQAPQSPSWSNNQNLTHTVRQWSWWERNRLYKNRDWHTEMQVGSQTGSPGVCRRSERLFRLVLQTESLLCVWLCVCDRLSGLPLRCTFIFLPVNKNKNRISQSHEPITRFIQKVLIVTLSSSCDQVRVKAEQHFGIVATSGSDTRLIKGIEVVLNPQQTSAAICIKIHTSSLSHNSAKSENTGTKHTFLDLIWVTPCDDIIILNVHNKCMFINPHRKPIKEESPYHSWTCMRIIMFKRFFSIKVIQWWLSLHPIMPCKQHCTQRLRCLWNTFERQVQSAYTHTKWKTSCFHLCYYIFGMTEEKWMQTYRLSRDEVLKLLGELWAELEPVTRRSHTIPVRPKLLASRSLLNHHLYAATSTMFAHVVSHAFFLWKLLTKHVNETQNFQDRAYILVQNQALYVLLMSVLLLCVFHLASTNAAQCHIILLTQSPFHFFVCLLLIAFMLF